MSAEVSVPRGQEMERRWRQLDKTRRVKLAIFSDMPNDRDEAAVALGFARHMRDRVRLWAMVGAVSVFVGALVVGALIEGGLTPRANFVAFLLGFGVAITIEVAGRVRAHRLERNAGQVLKG
jgi:hypothetical protein